MVMGGRRGERGRRRDGGFDELLFLSFPVNSAPPAQVPTLAN